MIKIGSHVSISGGLIAAAKGLAMILEIPWLYKEEFAYLRGETNGL